MPEAAQGATSRAFTVVITSCGRFDLLRQTVESLLRTLDAPPTKIVVTEDSGDEAVREVFSSAAVPVQIFVNRPQLGQMKSIDLAYGAVETEHVFHCEDDWEFLRGGYLAESFMILEQFPNVSMVGLRARAELNPLVRNSPVEELDGVRFFRMDPRLHPEYFSYSFNPGLRRLGDFRALAPIAPLGHEADVSYAFKRAGFQIANLEEPAVRHIGYERHVDDPTQKKRARTLPERLANSTRKRIKRVRRFFSER